MSDIEIESELVSFVEKVRLNESMWALGAEDGGFVVCESNQFSDTDVLLLWGTEDAAKAQPTQAAAGAHPLQGEGARLAGGRCI